MARNAKSLSDSASGKTLGEVQALIRRFRGTEARRGALRGVHEFWNRTLGAVNVDTPDPA